jgi:hypothetical protein
MGDLQNAVKTAVLTLAVIWVANQFPATRNLVQTALIGR